MLALSIISASIFAIYVIAVLIIFRQIPVSLSETFYMFDKRGPVFTLTMFALVITIISPMIDATPENFKWVAFLCPAAIGFVGAAPNFKEELSYTVHSVSAIASAVFGISWVVFLTPFWWIVMAAIVIVMMLGGVTKTLKYCKVWWLEMIAFLSVYSTLILTYLI